MADIDNQPSRDLHGPEARAKICELGRRMRSCMFGTQLERGRADFRPMAIQAFEDDASVWFLSSTNSDKNRDIVQTPRVLLTFQNDDASIYMSLYGDATIYADKATIDKYWTALANNWFEGKEDPRVTVLGVRVTEGHYWETKHGKIITMTKMILGAMTGGALGDDGGIDGQLAVK